MKDTFNPNDWLPSNEDQEPQPSNQSLNLSGSKKPDRLDIDLVVSRIESAQIDITVTYNDWLNLGFALADELGEGGRDYFHRISRFYPKYSHTDCNRQYDQCLKSKGHGITIKTLFHMAKQAGIEIGRQEDGDRRTEDGERRREEGRTENPSPVCGLPSSDSGLLSPVSVDLPTLPDSIFPTLPVFL